MITIEGNLDDRMSSIVYLLTELRPLQDLRQGDREAVNLEKVRYMGPDAITLVSGSILSARDRGVEVAVVPPSEPPALLAFLDLSGFNHSILGRPVPDPAQPGNVTVALRRFDQSRHSDPDPILDLIARFETVSEDLRVALSICFAEVVQNIEDHSRSPIGGLGCARYIQRDHEVRVALCDWGEGILRSLRRRYPDTQDDERALRLVLFGGYSSLSRANNAGRGIDNLRTIVTNSEGNMIIISGNGAADLRGRKEPRYSVHSFGFKGTGVFFTLPIPSGLG